MKKKTPGRQRKSLGRRVGESMNAIGHLGRTAVNQPRELPRHAEGMFRRWFRNVWAVRGGGLYATGFAAAFVYFEVTEFVTEDIGEIISTNLLSGDIVPLVISFIVDTFMNFVAALMWPYFIATFASPWGAIALGAAFVVFDRFLRPPIEAWLAREDDEDLAADSQRAD